jgi:hypothetical protein
MPEDSDRAPKRWPVMLWLAQLLWGVPALVVPCAVLVSGRSSARLRVALASVAGLAGAYVLAVILVAWRRSGRAWLRAHRWQLVLLVVAALATYALCEVMATTLYLAQVIDRGFWIYENSQQTVHFDPLRGYTLTETPARFARITGRTVEYLGALRGNAQGFPDRDDFAPRRRSPTSRRYAVFGDSFTAGQYLRQNWPDRVEDLTRGSDCPLELLNFAIDGGGLANWWSVLTRIVGPGQYEIDGVVFAVFEGDLTRGFTVAEHGGYTRSMLGRVPGFDPRGFPKTLEEARAFLAPLAGYILDHEQFEATLRGRSVPALERDRVPYVAMRLAERFGRLGSLLAPQDPPTGNADHRRLIEDLRDFVRQRGIPAIVVAIPSRENLAAEQDGYAVPATTVDFARALRAELVNGAQAFAGLTAREIRAHWFPYDGHWAQTGSDRFAGFMVRPLRDLSRRRPANRST